MLKTSKWIPYKIGLFFIHRAYNAYRYIILKPKLFYFVNNLKAINACCCCWRSIWMNVCEYELMWCSFTFCIWSVVVVTLLSYILRHVKKLLGLTQLQLKTCYSKNVEQLVCCCTAQPKSVELCATFLKPFLKYVDCFRYAAHTNDVL